MVWTWLILTVAYVVAIFVDSPWVWLGLTAVLIVVVVVTMIWADRIAQDIRRAARDLQRRGR